MTRSPSPPTRESADSIRNLLEQKLTAYRRFLSITETLGQKISAQAMEETGKLIAWRQDCIGWIETLDSRMKALEQSAPPLPRRTEADAAVEGLTAEICEILQKILRLDESMIGALAGYRGGMQTQLSAMTARKHDFQGYRPGGGQNARMLSVQT